MYNLAENWGEVNMKKWLVVIAITLGFVISNHASLWSSIGVFAASNTLNGSDSATQIERETRLLTTSFTSTRSAMQSYLIHNWSQVNATFDSKQDLVRRANQLKQELKLQNTKYTYNSSKNEHYLELTGNTTKGSFLAITEAAVRNSEASEATILILSLTHEAPSLMDFESEMKGVDFALKNVHIVPQISACIQGTLSARMSDARIRQLIAHTDSVVNARKVEGLYSSLVTSVSAYSPQDPAFISTNGKKMNLQVAVHYDSFHHRTNVLVGTPIITTTY